MVEEHQSIRASRPRACKKTSNVKPEDTPSNLPAVKKNLEKKPSEFQSAVARHLAESKDIVPLLTVTLRFVASVLVR